MFLQNLFINRYIISIDIVNLNNKLNFHIGFIRVLNDISNDNLKKFSDQIHLGIKMTFQMVLALRYLHKEKQIIHRDLSPNNIMLGENDRVTISKCLKSFDFDFRFFSNLFFYET